MTFAAGHVTGSRVAGLLQVAGYPSAVASGLAGLLVTTTPQHVLRGAPPAVGEGFEPRRRLLDRLTVPHLPQGAPTSPAAVNLLDHRLDHRLAGPADALDGRYGRYGRYADDHPRHRCLPGSLRAPDRVLRAAGCAQSARDRARDSLG